MIEETEIDLEATAKKDLIKQTTTLNGEHITLYLLSATISLVPKDPEEEAPKELKLPFFKLLKMLKLAKK